MGDSANVFTVLSSAGQVRMQTRSVDGGNSLLSASVVAAAPYWVRVVRSGDVFSGYVSTNSISWTLVDTQTVLMGSDLQACLASSSNVVQQSSVTVFEGVSVLPAPWTASDIGNVLPGFSSYYNKFILTAAGSGIGSTSDEGHFMCQPFTGDGSITARVSSVDNVGAAYQAGVMFRQSLTTNSRYSYMYVSNSGSAYNYYRTTVGGTTSSVAIARTIPQWVRMTKSGDNYLSLVSSDGITWTGVRTNSITMGTTPYACLVASSRVAATKGEAVFENVSVG